MYAGDLRVRVGDALKGLTLCEDKEEVVIMDEYLEELAEEQNG